MPKLTLTLSLFILANLVHTSMVAMLFNDTIAANIIANSTNQYNLTVQKLFPFPAENAIYINFFDTHIEPKLHDLLIESTAESPSAEIINNLISQIKNAENALNLIMLQMFEKIPPKG